MVLVFEYQGVPPPNDGVHCITSAVYFYLRSIFTAETCLFIRLISLVREIILVVLVFEYQGLHSLEHFIIDVSFAADYLYDDEYSTFIIPFTLFTLRRSILTAGNASVSTFLSLSEILEL